MSSIPISKIPFMIEDPIKYLNEIESLYVENKRELLVKNLDYVEKVLEEAISGKEKTLESLSEIHEVSVVFSLIWLASIVNDQVFSNKISVYLAKRYSKKLSVLISRGVISLSNIIEIANLLGIDVKLDKTGRHKIHIGESVRKNEIAVIVKQYNITIPYTSFLSLTKRLSGDPKYKLTNMILIDGKVLLSESDIYLIIRLLEEKFVEYISTLIEKFSSDEEILRFLEDERVLELINKIRQLAYRHLVSRERKTFGPVREDSFPPCIEKILYELRSGGNLSHHQRFAVVAFLGHVGMTREEIIDLFRLLPDFKEKVTSYQVAHIMGEKSGGKKYLPYSCEKMKTLGLCVADCNVKNPLQYYYLRLRNRYGGQGNSSP